MAVVSGGVVYGLTALARVSALSPGWMMIELIR